MQTQGQAARSPGEKYWGVASLHGKGCLGKAFHARRLQGNGRPHSPQGRQVGPVLSTRAVRSTLKTWHGLSLNKTETDELDPNSCLRQGGHIGFHAVKHLLKT